MIKQNVLRALLLMLYVPICGAQQPQTKQQPTTRTLATKNVSATPQTNAPSQRQAPQQPLTHAPQASIPAQRTQVSAPAPSAPQASAPAASTAQSAAMSLPTSISAATSAFSQAASSSKKPSAPSASTAKSAQSPRQSAKQSQHTKESHTQKHTVEKMTLPLYVGIILEKDNSYFLIERKNTNWAQGYWNFPGGLVEPKETIMHAAIRETQEEIGVTVKPEDFEQVHVIHVKKSPTNTLDIVGIYFKATKWTGTPHNAEPAKITNAQWFDAKKLPTKLTEHAQLAVNGLTTGKRYSESGW